VRPHEIEEGRMSRVDRAVSRASRHLAGGEVLVASAMGVEEEGRRRRVVLLTDRRLLVTSLRTDAPTELPLDGTRIHHDPGELRLTVTNGERELVVRDVDAADAQHLAGTLGQRQRRGAGRSRAPVPNVRIISR
jgi:hypothetical protein